jgi:release factor glutamine methyltransferase
VIDPSLPLAAHIAAATARLEAAGLPSDEARQSAVVLAAHALGWDRASLLVGMRDSPPAPFPAAYERLVARRASREPVAYITGEREFYGRLFAVTRDVLIPRPETELLVDEALRWPRSHAGDTTSAAGGPRPVIVDVGTGCGCLAITLALECPGARIIATDISEPALAVARQNADRFGVLDRIQFRRGSLLAAVAGPVDLVVSNPPYVPERDRAGLAPDVTEFEPGGALFAGTDGLSVVRALVPDAARTLGAHGWLVLEIGAGQSGAVGELITASGLRIERTRPDLQGIPRILTATRV